MSREAEHFAHVAKLAEEQGDHETASQFRQAEQREVEALILSVLDETDSCIHDHQGEAAHLARALARAGFRKTP